jgi:hypothetical protein
VLSPSVNPADPDDDLLLYAAGEMPPADQAALEHRLAADTDLQTRLTAVRAAFETTDAAFAAADAAAPAGPDVGRVAARASAAVRQWQAARTREATGAAAPRRPARSRVAWAAPTAAAAGIALLLGGVNLMRNWPRGEARTTRETRGDGGMPAWPGTPAWTTPEERDFHLTALRTLAVGSDALDEDDPAAPAAGPLATTNAPATADPSPRPVPVGQTVASAAGAAADEPYFDVPLSPEDATR